MARAKVLDDGLELKRKQLQLQHDQERLNLRAKISEVEAEERVYRMFEERDDLSDHVSLIVRSSVEKSPVNPNATERLVCTPSDVKDVSSVQFQGASVKVNEEACGARDEGANIAVRNQDPST